MSVKAMAWVWDQDIPRDEKFVLLAYADHSDHDGNNIYPSVGAIANKTGYSTRSIQRITQKLVELGFLIEIGTSEYQTNKYSIPMGRDDKMSSPISGGGGDKIDTEIDENVTGGVTKSTQRGDIAVSPKSSLTIHKPSSKPDINKRGAKKVGKAEQIREIVNLPWSNNDQIGDIDDLISEYGFDTVKEIAAWISSKKPRSLSHAINSMYTAANNWNGYKQPAAIAINLKDIRGGGYVRKETVSEMLDRQLQEIENGKS